MMTTTRFNRKTNRSNFFATKMCENYYEFSWNFEILILRYCFLMQLFRTMLIAYHSVFWWVVRFWYFSLTVKLCFSFDNAKFFFCFCLYIFFDSRAFDRDVFSRIIIFFHSNDRKIKKKKFEKWNDITVSMT